MTRDVSRIGPYEVVSAIGAGGMGEVLRARDTKLGREVAIKVLPAAFAQDAERVARFRREAQILASLNHPNIAAIHGLEESASEGSLALVMELVEGEDLAARLKRGAIPVDEAVAIARQIAEALEEAHEKGIVHRDLKPANVKVTSDVKVKVLDFGLAKAFAADPMAQSGGHDLSQSPTLAGAGTMAGVILGTAAYMSPEQARGKAVDKRADIWSFGVVLFEMLTGRRLFDGETVSDTLYTHFLPGGRRFLFSRGGGIAVGDLDSGEVKDIAPISSKAEYANGHLFYVKDGDLFAQPFDAQRLELSGEPIKIADDISWTAETPAGFAFSVSPSGVIAYWQRSGAETTQPTWFDRSGRVLGTLGEPAEYFGVALSPDERNVAIEMHEPGGGRVSVWLIDVATGTRSRFASHGEWVGLPLWSADSARVLVTDFSERLRVLPLGGGHKRRVSTSGGASPVWRRDGGALFHVAPNGDLVESELAASASGLRVHSSRVLFRPPPSRATLDRQRFAVTADGQRFLFNAIVPMKVPGVITLIQGWQPPQP